MKTYQKMKDSRIEWIGQIPDHWEIKKLKFSITQKTKKSEDNSLPYVGLENVESGTKKLLSVNEEMGESDAKSFEINDVLFGKLRPYLAKVLHAPFDGRCSGEFLVLHPEDYEPEYLSYLLISDTSITVIDSSTHGAKMPRAEWDFIGNLKLTLPPLREQKQISEFLDKETSKIYACIQKNRKLVELLKEKRQVIINHAVTKGLDPTVPMTDSGIEWIGEMPKHWSTTRNKFIFNFSKNIVGERSSKFQLLSMGKGGVNYRDRDSGEGKFPESFDNYQTVEPGDLVFCLFDIDETPRTIGYSKLHGMITSAYDVVKCFSDVEPKFIYYFYLSIDDRKGLRPFYTGLRKVVRSETFLGLKIKIPLFQEQKQISEFLDKETSKIDFLLSKTESQIHMLQNFRQSLISNAVTGKIDTRQEVLA